MARELAKIVSVVLHPWWIPTAVAIGYFAVDQNDYATKPIVILCTIVFTMVLPLVTLLIMASKGRISNLQLTSNKERQVPYIIYICCLLAYALTLVVGYEYTPYYLKLFIMSLVFQAFALSIINLWWKVSAHMCGWGTLFAFVVLMSWENYHTNLPLLIMIVLASGLAGWARLEDEAHTPMQLLVGYIIGFASPLIISYLKHLSFYV